MVSQDRQSPCCAHAPPEGCEGPILQRSRRGTAWGPMLELCGGVPFGNQSSLKGTATDVQNSVWHIGQT
eukprot:2431541-Alexandrium_andersonii.AAC.1